MPVETTHYIGTPVNRVEGRDKVTGRAKYAAEHRLPKMTHGVLVGAAIASGRIQRLDTAEAERAPGVVLVLTHKNRGPMSKPPNDQKKSKVDEERLPLANAKISRAGQYVAMVIAETLEQATYAASLVRVEYERAPFSVDSMQERASAYWAGKSSGEKMNVHRGNVPRALAEAEVRLDAVYRTPNEHPCAMEPHSIVASWANGLMTIYDSTQWVMGDQAAVAKALSLPREKVRVLAPYVGGMFGSKAVTSGHVLLTALASRRLGRPVKSVLSRQQVLVNVGHRTNTLQRFELGATRDGKLTAMRHSIQTHNSADAKKDDFIEPVSISSRMLYDVPNYQSQHYVVRLNVMRPSWMRGPGEMPCQYAMECALDELSCKLGVDPVELRRRNDTQMDPQRKTPFSSRHLLECYDRGMERFGWKDRDSQPRSMRDGNILIGWGMATASYPGNVYGATVKLRLERDGATGVRAIVSTAGIDVGTGMYTMMALTAAEGLGLPLEQVTPQLGDTRFRQCAFAGGSNLTASTAPPILQASRNIRGQLLSLAAAHGGVFADAPNHPDDFLFEEGQIRHRSGASDAIPYAELLAQSGNDALEAQAKTERIPGHDKHYTYHSTGAHFVEVRVHPEIGTVRVSRIVSVFDVGRILNAKAGRSQLMGGIVFGVGAALMEELIYDEHGRAVNANFADYLVPLATDIPQIDISWLDKPDYRFNELGCRGIGEIGITGSPAAVANAVYHATGLRVRDLPITPAKLLTLKTKAAPVR